MTKHDATTSSNCLVGWARHARGVALVVGGCALLAAIPVYAAQGRDGLIALLVAAMVCAGASIGAQFAAIQLAAGLDQPVHAALVAMMLRMAPPLVFCMAIAWQPGRLGAAGVVFYVLGFYLITLAVDTWLSVGRVPLTAKPGRG